MSDELTVTDVIDEGNLSVTVGQTFAQILEHAGSALNAAYAHEIAGNVIFRASDGHFYVATTEVMIGRANPVIVVDALEALTEEECNCVSEDGESHTDNCAARPFVELLDEAHAQLDGEVEGAAERAMAMADECIVVHEHDDGTSQTWEDLKESS